MNRHARLIKLGRVADPVHASKLIADYASSPTLNSLSQVQRVFDQVPFNLRDTPLWASLISAYSRSNQPLKALQIYSDMIRQHSLNPAPDTRPNSYVFTSVVRAIASVPEQVSFGQALHAHVIKEGLIPQCVFLGTALVYMYGKCGVTDYASKLFDEMPQRNLVTWNTMLSVFVRNGMERVGLDMFRMMTDGEVCLPDEFTVATVLTGCAEVQDLVLGMQVHGYAIIRGFELDCLGSIANMYFYCGVVESAEKVLNGTEDDVFFNLIKIRGYIFNYNYQRALKCISSDKHGVKMLYWDHTLITPLLSTCTKLSFLKVGKQLHGMFIVLTDSFASVNSLEDNVYIGSALIDMYSKCGDVGAARRVFDSWLYRRDVSHGNAMIAGYVYNGLIEDARTIFEIMPEKNVISWTSMMMGYVQGGWPDETLNLLTRMHFDTEGFMVRGNSLSFVVGLEACRDLTHLEKGKQIHAKILRTLTTPDINSVVVGTALVDMYSKSGKLVNAQKVFDSMMIKNIFAWTCIIMGYAVHGFCFNAIEVFQQMINTAGFEPNEVTFIAVLTACSHGGLVVEGLQYFKMMTEKYNLIPMEDHYTCIIDLLGRSGRLDEAWNLLVEIEEQETIHGCPTSTAWAALLGACHVHDNVELGERVAKKIEYRTQISSMHIALSNVYSASGMWNEAYGVRQNWRKERSFTCDPGLSRIYGGS